MPKNIKLVFSPVDLLYSTYINIFNQGKILSIQPLNQLHVQLEYDMKIFESFIVPSCDWQTHSHTLYLLKLNRRSLGRRHTKQCVNNSDTSTALQNLIYWIQVGK